MKQICDDIIDRVQEYILPIGCSFDVERRNFIKELSTCDLLAVPGSGKTTALIAKLCCMAENLEDGEAIRRQMRQIANLKLNADENYALAA